MKLLNSPLILVAIYCTIGILWVLIYDMLIDYILSRNEIFNMAYLYTFRGLVFVGASGIVLYFFIKRLYKNQLTKVIHLEKLNLQLLNQKEELRESMIHQIESEKSFSDLFNTCPLPMWVFDQVTFRFLDVNIAALNLYGYCKSEFLDMTILDIRPEEDIDRVKKIVNLSFTDEFSEYKGIFRHIKKNQEEIQVRIKSSTIEYKGENTRLVVANDITELVETQQDLKNAYDSIVKIEECERARFAGELHDSLGQNLIVIKQYLAIIPEEKSSEKIKSMYSILTEVVDDTIKECKELIHDLRPKELYDGGIKDIILSTCDRINQSGDLTISYEIAEEVDQILDLNTKFHIFRMFQENLNNTMKHSEATVALVELAKRNNKIHFFFSDNGKGIDPKTLAAESSFLSLKRRVMSLGGTYDIQSDLGSGMAFYCKIPIN